MKKIKLLILISVLIVILFPKNVLARYYQSFLKINGKATIAEPIIRVEPLQETITAEINKNVQIQEYFFIVKNYENDSNNNKRINEVDFSFYIEIENSNDNFPVKYELYDCETNLEILKDSNRTESMDIIKNEEYEKKYKLLVNWNELPIMSNINNTEIIVRVEQKNN